MYSLQATLTTDFATAVTRVKDELKKEGFGVLVEIDMQSTLKAKMNKDMAPYLILGACNPPFASQALDADPEIGLLLPCNVVVREAADHKIIVSIIDPVKAMSVTGRDDVAGLANEVYQRLERVQKALS